MTRSDGWIAVALFALGAARVLWLASRGVEHLVQFVPDDAFYYIEIARNVASGQGFSFDGENPATGFHPLHLLCMAAVFWVVPSLEFPGLFIAFGLLAVACTALAFWVMARRLASLGYPARLGLLWVFGGVVTWEMQSHLMETPWVVLAAALTLRRLGAGGAHQSLWVSAGIGCFGSLARTDFVVFPVVLAAVAYGARWAGGLRGGPRMDVRSVSAVAVGALVGLTLAACLHASIGGSWWSASAQIKSHWGAVLGDATRWILVYASAAIGGCFAPASGELMVTALGTLACSLLALRVAGDRWLSLGLMASGVAYLLVYRRLGGLQAWYVGAFVVPVAWLVAHAVSIGCPRRREAWAGRERLAQEEGHRASWPGYGGWRGQIVALVAIVIVVGWSLSRSFEPRYRGQQTLWRWAKQLDSFSSAPPDAAFGSWNAGILGHFSQRRIINLDGLVNDRAVGWIRRGALFDYIDDAGIDWIIDNPVVLRAGWLAARGGYSVEEAAHRTRRVGSRSEPSSTLASDMSLPVFAVLAPTVRPPGDELSFQNGESAAGWGFVEPTERGIWFGTGRANLPLVLAADPAGSRDVRLELEWFLPADQPEQRVLAEIGGRTLAEWMVGGTRRHDGAAIERVEVVVPKELLVERDGLRRVRLEFEAPNLGLAAPYREWAPSRTIALRSLRLVPD